MLKYLIQFPCEVIGHNMLGFLELIDIMQFEKAAVSYKSQQLLKSILPYYPPIVEKVFKWKQEAVNWINKRRCRVKYAIFPVESLCGVDIQHYIFNDIELQVIYNIPMQHIEARKNTNLISRVTSVNIKGKQDPAVMEVLFSLLGSVRSLNIESPNLSQWIKHIKPIRPCLREITIHNDVDLVMLTTLTECCPYLENLSFDGTPLSGDNILQSIANNCPHLRSLDISVHFIAVYDLTAFVEKCPQLEELSLHCPQLTDQSVIALAQHCSRLQKLDLYWCAVTVDSLIAISERGLHLEELIISPSIPIPSAEIAGQCAYALSKLYRLSTVNYLDHEIRVDYSFAIQYMAGLRELYLDSSEDHLLVPHLLLLLQGQCFAGLERLTIYSDSSITSQQICELVARCCNLRTLYISKSTCIFDAELVDLASSCPHLQEIALNSSELTEEGVLALAAHCRQLRVIHIPYTTVTKETVRQLTQHCRRLTELHVRVKQGENVYTHKKLTKRDIKALREYA